MRAGRDELDDDAEGVGPAAGALAPELLSNADECSNGALTFFDILAGGASSEI